jgi:lipopolysaccharide transport system ATP-binding protein
VSEPGVVVEGVWKRFQRGEHHDSLRDLIPALLSRRGVDPGSERTAKRSFWAVQDVSFEVRKGMALGIIGPNGAGKSTLLKLLTRILRPTRGTIHVTGRQGALIEVSAGFHQDLTGRENVYLQGAIMGMPPKETARKFDQIVEFSGVSDFIDTPVKRYSSGMNARLGFAIAAHLDPDVLFIDEVLAVGDFAFQTRAFGRIRELATSGIPVIVVSHQLDRVSELCTHALLLDHGQVVLQGSPRECIDAYLNPKREGIVSSTDAPAIIERLVLEPEGDVVSGATARVRMDGRVFDPDLPDHIDPVVFIMQNAATGALLSAFGASNHGVKIPFGPFSVVVDFQMNVPPGVYVVRGVVGNHQTDAILSAGPSLVIRVTAAAPFRGAVQLNPRMWLAPSIASTGAGAGAGHGAGES